MHQPDCLARALLVSWVLAWAGNADAQAPEEDELAREYGDKSVVSIATGNAQPIIRAPAVASVITAEDIRNMGATDLDQVLESVPGLHVSHKSLALYSLYNFRGIASNFNPHVLILVNGISINNAFLGGRTHAWGGMPLENVARIEVIRGPGSALYGANAFSGVINVITKTTDDLKGTEYGVRAGSFDSRDAWIQHGGKLGPLDAAFYLRAGHTDGDKSIVQQDAQSRLDRLLGTHASLAPGPVNALRNALDARADLFYQQWRFRAGYQKREVGVGAGIADSLAPKDSVIESRLYLDLSYQNANWAPNWEVSHVLGYSDTRQRPSNPAYVLFPPGAFGGIFPNGVLGGPGHSERSTHGSLSATYTGVTQHRVRLGGGFQIDDLYEVTETRNFTIGSDSRFVSLGELIDSTGNPSLVFLLPHKRRLAYAFVQDEWNFVKDWTLTAGVRHDRYSDFGGTTNPRLALVWNAAYNVVVKAMHGRAFRAPSFTEQYNINNPVATGNPNIKPETIATSELAVSWRPRTDLYANLSLFHYRMRDIIRFVPNADPATGATAQNTGEQIGRGLELEATWDATRDVRLTGSYSLQHSIDEVSGQDAGLAPHRRLFARADWLFAPRWQFGAIVNHVADRKRQPGDTRPQIADYATVDLTLARKSAAGWEVRAMVQNLFNRDVREPSFAPGAIPFDVPLPGRTFYLQFRHGL